MDCFANTSVETLIHIQNNSISEPSTLCESCKSLCNVSTFCVSWLRAASNFALSISSRWTASSSSLWKFNYFWLLRTFSCSWNIHKVHKPGFLPTAAVPNYWQLGALQMYIIHKVNPFLHSTYSFHTISMCRTYIWRKLCMHAFQTSKLLYMQMLYYISPTVQFLHPIVWKFSKP